MVWPQVDQRMRFRFGGVVGPERADVFWAAVAAVAALFAARLPSNAIKSPCSPRKLHRRRRRPSFFGVEVGMAGHPLEATRIA